MGRLERLERFHPQLAGRHILLVDKSIYTPGYVSLMTGLERMRVTNYATLQLIPDLSLFMDNAKIDFAIIHNVALGEANRIIEAVQKGKIVIVQEKNPDLELNANFNHQLQTAHVKTFSRTEPDVKKAFKKCLDYLATCV